MDVEQFKEDVRQGRVDVDRLVELVVTLARRREAAQRRIEELERQLGGAATAKIQEPFSLRAEEKRQQARGKKRPKKKRPRRRGRITTADKIACAERTEPVFPEGLAEADCTLSHTRVVWRLEHGRAVLVAYEVHRGPSNRYGKIPGVLGRSEFGLEIVLVVADQVYIAGLSFDKVCLLLNFFQNRRRRQSPVDALLNQLSRHWAREFDGLCALLAHSAVAHADETGWSLNSVGAFLSENARVLFFGVPQDAQTLAQILDPATFAGLVVSDDAAVYANFAHAQKCWAHLLRKAIKLTLLEPANGEYRRFADRLLEIYRAACRTQRDGRLGDTGRARKVGELEDDLLELCAPMWAAELAPSEGAANDYRLLGKELMRLMLDQQLFTFVTAPAVTPPGGATLQAPGTNQEAERTLRTAAQARQTGRANKTLRGGRLQTILVSVLESLRQQLATLTLSGVVEEILHWSQAGRSCFATLLAKRKLKPSRKSPRDLLLPVPGG